ncbi:MAG: beta-ketoacyl-[acyl-carrier-protein] synthase family protein [Proteobacteria bacterium]|nr:beta-ketoacyl-[acyl-carrier-protein] synthase family protein [Pseudomonadota bacterium]
MRPLVLSAYTATSCIGHGTGPMLATLRAGRTGLTPCPPQPYGLDTCVGRVAAADDRLLPAALSEFDCRNNRLAFLGLAQDGFSGEVRARIARYGSSRIGVFMGTSTSGVRETEQAFAARDPDTGALPAGFNYAGVHNTFSIAAFVARALQLTGPATVISSACSSSAKVFASARRAIESGLIDAAVVGGVDSLCLTTLHGFNSLQLVSRRPVRPFDAARDGISIGEAAAFALLEPADAAAGAIHLVGTGESSDAHHMSAPHPQGRGARDAMERALHSAGLAPEQIGYINFHGTGTPSNDEAESRAVAACLGTRVPGSSTKGATGHTLGAAGALEVVICALALREGFMPGGVNTTHVDPALPVTYLLGNQDAELQYAMSNSFGFGGSNCSLVLARAN